MSEEFKVGDRVKIIASVHQPGSDWFEFYKNEEIGVIIYIYQSPDNSDRCIVECCGLGKSVYFCNIRKVDENE